jgi:hypothetical protein
VEDKNVIARPHASSRAPGTQARELSPEKASTSKRHGPSQELRRIPHNRVAGIGPIIAQAARTSSDIAANRRRGTQHGMTIAEIAAVYGLAVDELARMLRDA